ncbi:2-dehydropantoate 2-reductase [Christensenella sp. MSJ-20]|uniref:ketopantoate reductase family protein n=1 Tax=Christensenella sp. MSJ-20 TaxID=2841518 RepID=UPI001C74A3A8|nr:2-dehydropantoate 2-reductase [Christensenella sp. MSJ-20]
MRIAIYGAGSLGTILGAYLTKAGLNCELINRNQAHVEALRTQGARVTGTVELTVPVKALLPQEMSGEYDVIFLMTKQLHNPEVVSFLKPYLGETGLICTLQNGIPEPAIAELIGKDRVVGCTVAWGATLLAPGVSQLTSEADSLTFGMGTMEGVGSQGLKLVKGILEHMCPVEVEDNFMGVRWSKLLINAAFSGLGTVIGGTFGDVSEDPRARRVAQYLIKECIDVGHAAGVTFAPVQGKDIVRLLYFKKGGVKRWLSYRIIPIAMKKHRLLKPSMLQDIEHGKPCEVDAINGVVCQFGRQHGVPTPFNDMVVRVIQEMERGEGAPRKDNLDRFQTLF